MTVTLARPDLLLEQWPRTPFPSYLFPLSVNIGEVVIEISPVCDATFANYCYLNRLLAFTVKNSTAARNAIVLLSPLRPRHGARTFPILFFVSLSSPLPYHLPP